MIKELKRSEGKNSFALPPTCEKQNGARTAPANLQMITPLLQVGEVQEDTRRASEFHPVREEPAGFRPEKKKP